MKRRMKVQLESETPTPKRNQQKNPAPLGCGLPSFPTGAAKRRDDLIDEGRKLKPDRVGTVQPSDAILEELLSRHGVEFPDPNLKCFKRAYWDYLTMFVDARTDIDWKYLSLYQFVQTAFRYRLSGYGHTSARKTAWKKYCDQRANKIRAGAIILNDDLTKFVAATTWESSRFENKSYGVARGGMKKRDFNDPVKTAIREVKEEFGYDITSLINPDLCIEKVMNGVTIRLYIIIGVSETTVFDPNRYQSKFIEVDEICWLPISSLQPVGNDMKLLEPLSSTVQYHEGANNLLFFELFPFISDLVELLQNLRVTTGPGPATMQHQPSSQLPPSPSLPPQLPMSTLPEERLPPPPMPLNDRFRKTQATPPIYYLPLTNEEVEAKLAAKERKN